MDTRFPLAVLVLSTVCSASLFAAPGEPGPEDPDAKTLKQAGFADDDQALLKYFRDRTPAGVDRAAIAALIQQLGDDDFEVREQASAKLVKLGSAAVPLLQRAARHDDVEIARRAEKCLALIGEVSPAASAAAARLLARRRPAGAGEALLGFYPFAENESVAEEVQTALASLAYADGEPDKVLQAALKDRGAARRAAAAVALIASGSAERRRD